MTGDNNIQSVGALKLAAVVQAILGAVVAGFGVLGLFSSLDSPVRSLSFQDCIYFTYLIIGLAAMLVALPLARRVRWAWLTSMGLAGSIPLLAVTDMMSVYTYNSNHSLHGSEGTLLLLLVALPSIVFLGVLYSEGRSALRD
jgi:hypothetical protein